MHAIVITSYNSMLLIVVYFVSRDADRSRGGRKTKMPSYLKSLLQQHRSEFDSSAAWLAVEVFDNDFSFQMFVADH